MDIYKEGLDYGEIELLKDFIWYHAKHYAEGEEIYKESGESHLTHIIALANSLKTLVDKEEK